MKLTTAIDVFTKGFAATRSRTHPCIVERVEGLSFRYIIHEPVFVRRLPPVPRGGRAPQRRAAFAIKRAMCECATRATGKALSPHLSELSSADGHDAVHVREMGLAAASDEMIFGRAAVEERTVISADTDFGGILVVRGATKP